jgi:AcrR family transcriptional regulator
MQDCNSTDPVLEAARATVLDFGVRRTTLTEVARRAGLSRMTVYRRYSDTDTLMRALMSSEFGGVLEGAQAAASALAAGRGRVVSSVIGTVRALMEDPLMLRLLELEPEAMLPYLTERVGAFQQAARATLAETIAEAQAAGTVRPGDPGLMSESIELAVRGVVIAARALEPAARRQAVGELERMIESYLRP